MKRGAVAALAIVGVWLAGMMPAAADDPVVPFTLVNNHIYVDAAVNGSRPVPFLFDTGAIATLDRTTASSLGITTEGTLRTTGFGNQVRRSGIGHVESVALGRLALENQDVLVLDLARVGDADGMPVGGLIGNEFLRRWVTIIDYQHRRLRFVDPGSFRIPAGATMLPLAFQEHAPVIDASLDGIAGTFEIDTGNRGSLSLMRPFVESHKLLDRYGPGIDAVTGYGVGGPTRSLVARAEMFHLGDLSVTSPVADLEQDRHGLAASVRLAGNIGGGILKRFTVTLDYAGRRLFLEPNEGFDAPDIYDRSGLWLMADTAGIRVDDVVADGPGEHAGLRRGDRILAVDGASIMPSGLAALRERLRAAPGTTVRLAVARGGTRREFRVVLAELV